jgi:hypothetical protein
MNITIYHVNGWVLHEGEAESLKQYVEFLVREKKSLVGARLDGARLDGARLVGARLDGARLVGASLVGARLDRARLDRARLDGARLDGARLDGASLVGASLDGARLDRARLDGASLDGASGINPYRCTPLLMLLDQPGPIRAYKLVTASGYGPFNRGLQYKIGHPVEVHDADPDVSVRCSRGIHVATLDWCMREWQPGYRILIVEFTATDIAAIPTATDGKFRLHRCRVVGEKNLEEIGLVEATKPVEEASA